MRLAQLTALLAVWVELRLALGASLDGNWDREESAVIPALLVLLVLGELVRFGRWLSINRLVLLGHFARFTGLGWAGTGFLALLLTWLVPDLADDIGPHVLFWIAGGLAVATSLNAFTIGRTRIVVRKFEIASPNIPEPGDATTAPSILRISVLSDLHLGEFVAATHIRKAVQISNAESPDIVLLLGDYVDRDAALAGVLVDELTRLEAKFGV
ncbi:MAG: metallophosphoesterase, partial [Dehalococcoidia bacterium]|nr:metallophosphoesterase [Dehalococcoidia bacterium]